MNEPTEYGAASQSTAPGPIALGWNGAGLRATSDSGLMLMGARVYNPETGRFSSTDPIRGGNANAYNYPNSPTTSSDLSGMKTTYGKWSGWTAKTTKAKGCKGKSGGKSRHRSKTTTSGSGRAKRKATTTDWDVHAYINSCEATTVVTVGGAAAATIYGAAGAVIGTLVGSGIGAIIGFALGELAALLGGVVRLLICQQAGLGVHFYARFVSWGIPSGNCEGQS